MESEKYVRRTHWRKLPMTQIIIDKMNVLAGDKLITAADINADSTNQTDLTERIIPMVEMHWPPESTNS